jgi:alginate O-acetyltransferase complex protein AlgI
MLFNSPEFLIFFPTVYGVYLALPGPSSQNVLLLVASWFFYAWAAPWFVVLLAFYTGLTYLVGIGIEWVATARRRKWMLYAGLALNLGVLGYFKYYNFFAEEVGRGLAAVGWRTTPLTLNIALPIGVSFFTFQSIAYLVDVYRGRFPATRDLLVFAVFKSFFPQLVAGPIERAQHMMPQIEKRRTITADDLLQGAFWVLLGLFLKCVIADRVASLVDYNFMLVDGPNRGPLAAFNGLLAFTIQIYGDFAGYSYIAMGVSRLMGFELVRNFRGPYLATSIQDFWRKWHVSLSDWLRDYLYVPLGGSRFGTARTYLNLLATMTLGGLWHGASWTFLAWGLYHGAALSVHRALHPFLETLPAALRRYGGWVVTLLIVMGGWAIFRARSPAELHGIFARMLDWTGGVAAADIDAALVLLAFFGVVVLVQWVEERPDAGLRFRAEPVRPWQLGTLAMLFLAVLGVGFGDHRFIYFQF